MQEDSLSDVRSTSGESEEGNPSGAGNTRSMVVHEQVPAVDAEELSKKLLLLQPEDGASL